MKSSDTSWYQNIRHPECLTALVQRLRCCSASHRAGRCSASYRLGCRSGSHHNGWRLLCVCGCWRLIPLDNTCSILGKRSDSIDWLIISLRYIPQNRLCGLVTINLSHGCDKKSVRGLPPAYVLCKLQSDRIMIQDFCYLSSWVFFQDAITVSIPGWWVLCTSHASARKGRKNWSRRRHPRGWSKFLTKLFYWLWLEYCGVFSLTRCYPKRKNWSSIHLEDLWLSVCGRRGLVIGRAGLFDNDEGYSW